MSSPGQSASWLCRDDADRERVVDMERRIKPTRTLTFALIAAALVFAGPWEGWWTLIPLALATVLFAVADRLDRAHRQARVRDRRGLGHDADRCTATSIALTGGIHSPALGWLAIPVVTLGARFDARGVAAGMAPDRRAAAGVDARGRPAGRARPPATSSSDALVARGRRRAAVQRADGAPTASTAANRCSTA